MPKKIIYFIILVSGGIALTFSPCLIKTFSGYPCPACGTRRAMETALDGHFFESILINPYGIIVLLLILIFAVGFLYDKITRTRSFYSICKKVERLLANKYIIALLVILTLLNWIWNIHKGI